MMQPGPTLATLVATVAIDVIAWVAISAVWGTAAGWFPTRFLARDTWWTRIRPWEAHGRWYRGLGVKRWKDTLPESNRLGPGQRRSKRELSDRAGYADFIAETRRAEYVHVAIAVSGMLFMLWNPLWLGLVMVVFGVLFNLPFIIVQRYNRARLIRVNDALGRRAP